MRLDKETEDKLRELAACSESLVKFRKCYLASENDVESPDFHHTWSEILLHGRSNYAIEGFRESGKDQIVFQANIMHALTFPTDYRSYILLVGANKTDMASKLRDITRQWQSPQHDFLRANVRKIVEDSGDAFEVSYTDGHRVRIETFGKGGSIRGRVWGVKRPDIIILNDIQDPDDIRPDSDVPEAEWNWFISNILFMGKACRIFMIGNNVGARCIIERTIAHAKALNFRTMRIGEATFLEDDGVTVKIGEPTWPQRWSKEDILAEYMAFKSVGKVNEWMREKMCANMSPLSRPLHSDRLVEFDWHDEAVAKDLADAVKIMVVDPALSKKATADPSVIATVADTKSGKCYILDMDFRRRDPNELVDDILKNVSRWRPSSVGIETVAYQQALVVMLENERKRRELPPDAFRVVEIKTRQNKNLKIAGRLQPLLEAGLFYVPKNASWLPAFKAQMEAFPDGEHDDMLDALAMKDDAKIDRLVPTFSVQQCVTEPVNVPANWPRWASLAALPNGQAILLIMVCSPEGRLYVTNEITGITSPSELFTKYTRALSNRPCQMVFAPKEMFEPDPLTGNVWAGPYMEVGFPLCPGGDSWRVLLPEMITQFETPSSGGLPRLMVFRECQELIWELSSSVKGDEGRDTIIALRALMMILAHRPSWKDMTNEDRYGDVLRYPDADIP